MINKGRGKGKGRGTTRGQKPSRPFNKPESRTGGEKSSRSTDDNKKTGGYKGTSTGPKKLKGPGGKRAEHLTSKSDELRLNRFLALSGICSRREADDLIKAGLVTVNGNVVTELGTKVKPTDDVRYNGTRLKSEKPVYILLNKPKGFITTTSDERARKTVMDLVGNACKERIYPVGRLDRATVGLLLFTNDGDMAKKLTHPSNGANKLYHVVLDKNLKTGDIEKIKNTVTLEDGPVPVDSIAHVADKSKNNVGIELHVGRNRIVRRLFESLGYEVVKLDRVMFAGLTKKNLARGQWRFLTHQEINFLKML